MYSKADLKAILAAPQFNPYTQKVVNDLSNRMYRGDKLSLAEERFLGIIFGASIDEHGQREDMHQYPALKNDLFRRLYPSYVRNRDGWLPQSDAYGEIPIGRRMKDVAFLEAEYQHWNGIIWGDKHNSTSLQCLANETKIHLAKVEEFAKNALYGSRVRNAMLKEVVLHSKYLLFVVDEYYQELHATEQIVNSDNEKFVVDCFGYIHTLFRHYAQHIKDYQSAKSYHLDMGFDFESLPNSIVTIIASYFRNLPGKKLEDDRMFVRIRGTLYALWFRKLSRTLKGGVKEFYYRFQTFYPVVSQKDMLYISDLQEIMSDDGYGLLHKA